eukprot:TRINITY_DN2180_c0_g1_i1.p1 TRINITY_DN2180_c0_g1~~TRINITY_DN2180_c0_g1_i1.p1  ORF type:complete len:208 (-),score=48.36 TRINITY_DN2180_c0_g1_i1:1342-1965(-)
MAVMSGPQEEPVQDTVERAIQSNRIEDVASICERMELEGAAIGTFQSVTWPYAAHLLGLLYNNDLNNARFLWKRIPASEKNNNGDVAASWRIGQAMWAHDRKATYAALREHSWSGNLQQLVMALTEKYSEQMFALLCKAYSTISAADAAEFLGKSKEDAIAWVVQRGWSHDATDDMLTVVSQAKPTDQKTSLDQMQHLTEYVFHLDH